MCNKYGERVINKYFMPRFNTNDDVVRITKWHIKNHAYIEQGEPLVDVESSKANITIESDFSGYVFNLTEDLSTIRVGEIFCEIAESKDEIEENNNSEILKFENNNTQGKKNANNQPKINISQNIDEVNKPLTPNKISGGKIFSSSRFSDDAIKIIEKLGLDPEIFNGYGLITKNNIHKIYEIHQNQIEKNILTLSKEVLGPITPREEDISLGKKEEIKQLTLGSSGNIESTLAVTFQSEKIQNFLNKDKLFSTISGIIYYEIAQLLPSYPKLTSYFQNEQIHYYDRVDLGIAVDLGRGLKVVRIKDANEKNFEDLIDLVGDIPLRYMRNEIEAEELVGSTITVSDLSSYDILNFRPLINGYQSVILGLGGDSTLPGHPISIIATFDHRVLAGAEIAHFLNHLKKNIIKNYNYE
jgi:pyruvate/2-oxoglutarate dehydrogenase complex dihydrolipoamide acyltransferase (E2) component